MIKAREDAAIEKAEKQLRGVQSVQKKKQQAEHKGFIIEVKRGIKEIYIIQALKRNYLELKFLVLNDMPSCQNKCKLS